MIVIKLQGGLGNQMFQYAFGLSISQTFKSPLYFDGSFFEDDHQLTKRQYQLDLLETDVKFASKKQLDRFLKPTRLQKLLGKLTLRQNYTYRESSLRFDKKTYDTALPAYMEGFWPSEQYFKNYEQQIRQQFIFKNSLNYQSQALAAQISAQSNTVSIHVRRGDYVGSKTTHDIHGLCSLSYYKSSVDLINSRITKPDCYVFSDDIVWAYDNLHPMVPGAKFISHNKGDESWQDLALMRLCKHQIIANSTFSWWAAWLNPCKEKIVIAPKRWFKTQDSYFDAADIIPESWIKIGDE